MTLLTAGFFNITFGLRVPVPWVFGRNLEFFFQDFRKILLNKSSDTLSFWSKFWLEFSNSWGFFGYFWAWVFTILFKKPCPNHPNISSHEMAQTISNVIFEICSFQKSFLILVSEVRPWPFTGSYMTFPSDAGNKALIHIWLFCHIRTTNTGDSSIWMIYVIAKCH